MNSFIQSNYFPRFLLRHKWPNKSARSTKSLDFINQRQNLSLTLAPRGVSVIPFGNDGKQWWWPRWTGSADLERLPLSERQAQLPLLHHQERPLYQQQERSPRYQQQERSPWYQQQERLPLSLVFTSFCRHGILYCFFYSHSRDSRIYFKIQEIVSIIPWNLRCSKNIFKTRASIKD